LIEKDKIASIIPSTPAGKPEPASASKKDAAQHPSKPAGDSQPQAEPAVASSSDTSAAPTAGKAEKARPKITNASVKPEVPTNTATANVAAPTIKGSPAATAN